MARHPFGGTTADFVESVRTDGTLQADVGATCTFFTAQTGGLAIVDLQDMNGNPITSVAADGFGWIPPFMGPNDGSAQMWVSAGGSARQLIQATDLSARVATLESAGYVKYVKGLLAAQPTAVVFGVGFYFATDQNGGTLYESDGTTWTQQSPGVSAVGMGQRITTASITVNFTTASTVAVDATGLSVTFTAIAGATYEVKFIGFVGNNTAGSQAQAQLTDAANTILRLGGPTPRTAGDSFFTLLQTDVAPAAGSVTYKMRLLTNPAGTAFILGGATFPAQLYVTRVG